MYLFGSFFMHISCLILALSYCWGLILYTHIDQDEKQADKDEPFFAFVPSEEFVDCDHAASWEWNLTQFYGILREETPPVFKPYFIVLLLVSLCFVDYAKCFLRRFSRPPPSINFV